MEKTLIIAAHPDDDILGCGGYMSKFAKKEIIKVVFLQEGTSCRFSKNQVRKELIAKEIDKRKNMAIKALKFLKINKFKFYNFPCGRLDSIDILDLNKIIENEIKEFKPNKILTHNEDDCNNDHRIVNRSVMMASRPLKKNKFIRTLMVFEILSSTELNYSNNFSPNYFEILSKKDLDNKIKALKFFKTEYQKKPFPRSDFGLKTLANFRGLQTGNEFAEAYKVVKIFN